MKNVLPPSKEKHYYSPELEECPEKPPKLVGYLDINFNHDAPTSDWLANRYSNLGPGGRFTPDHCQPVNRVAIVIPYRNRDEHLRYFLEYMHAILQRQDSFRNYTPSNFSELFEKLIERNLNIKYLL